MNPLSVVNLVFGIIELLLATRFFFLLVGISTAAPFMSVIMAFTDPLMRPFINAFPSPVAAQGMVFDFTALLALLMYAVLHYLIIELFAFIKRAFEKTPAPHNP